MDNNLKNIISFSVDDVLASLLWLERTEANTIFQSYTFEFARWLYEQYKIPTTCNLLYSDGKSNLSSVSERFKQEFEMHSDWLKFSFHGLDYTKSYENASYKEALNDYQAVESNIIRICGEKSLSKIVRSHFFSGSNDAVKAWADEGVEVLLAADDDRCGDGINYNLSVDEISDLRRMHSIKKNNLTFVRTDIRLEKLKRDSINEFIYKNKYEKPIVVFTHEKYVKEKWIRLIVEDLINAVERGEK